MKMWWMYYQDLYQITPVDALASSDNSYRVDKEIRRRGSHVMMANG